MRAFLFSGLICRRIPRLLNAYQQTACFSLDLVGKSDAEQPFDYVNKRFNAWNRFFYSTLGNIGDNTLCISVEGNHGTRRSQIAKRLADIIGFLYIPPPDLDRMYYQRGRYNMKETWNDCVLPDKRVVNWEEWLADCSKNNTVSFYYYKALTSMYQYRMGTIHMLSTGQGVLFDGCYWSDRVFARALHQYGLIDDIGLEAFDEISQMFDYELKRPHLVVYIDRPVDDCMREIQENSEAERKCWLFQDTKYLKMVEKMYQSEFLNPMDKTSHILRYKFDDVMDNENMIAEDMEFVNFEDKCTDWKIAYTTQLDDYREHLSTEYRWKAMVKKLRKQRQVPQLTTLGEEAQKVNRLLKEHPNYVKIHGSDLPYLEQIKLYYTKWIKGEPMRPFY